MNLKALVPLFAILFIAGCVTQPSKPAGIASGVVITQFSPEVSEVFQGEEVAFSAIVQNVGNSTATNVYATIFGISPTEWDISPQTQQIPDLEPGEEYEATWSAKAPTISVPEFTFTPMVRVEYKYRTAASATLRFIKDDYYKSLPVEQRKSIKTGIISTTVSKGPISVSFSTTRKLFKVSKPIDKVPIKITIQNIGQGIPKYNGEKKVYLTITTSGLYLISCPDLGTMDEGTITLIRGERKSISCEVTPGEFTNIIDGIVTVNVDYNYYVDASTTIKVIRPEESQIKPQ